MKNDYLLNHARINVNAKPQGDKQYTFQLPRLCGNGGVKGQFLLGAYLIDMPDKTNYYYIYRLGRELTENIGFSNITPQWNSIAALCNDGEYTALFYSERGKLFPNSFIYAFAIDNTIYMAVRRFDKIDPLGELPLFLRLYTPKYFSTNATPDEIVYDGIVVNTTMDVQTFMDRYLVYAAKMNSGVGRVYITWNGEYVSGLNVTLPNPGDTLEFFYSSAYYRVERFRCGDLRSFFSAMDNAYKYILHPPKASHNGRINHYTDIDVFLCRKDGSINKGAYIHRNVIGTMRMLTQDDYALRTDHLYNILNQYEGWTSLEDSIILLIYNDSGWVQDVPFNSSKTGELYKLDDERILEAMAGTESNLVEWRAENLERNAFNALMNMQPSAITNPDVTQAYGYDSVCTVLSPNPLMVVDEITEKVVYLPPYFSTYACVYEYDTKGHLIGMYNFTANANLRYVVQNPMTCVLVEAYPALGGLELDYYETVDPIKLKVGYNYRVYRTPLGTPLGKGALEDITLDEDAYLIDEYGNFYFAEPAQYTLVSDEKLLTYSFPVSYDDGGFQFDIQCHDHLGFQKTVWSSPYNVELWLNGHPLIEGLDYRVDWPTVYLVNKQYYRHDNDELTVRCINYADGGAMYATDRDFGYVLNGQLSADSHYDVRDDRPVRIVVGGSLRRREEVGFSEDGSVTIDMPDGTPYIIDAYNPSTDGLIGDDKREMLAVSRDLNQRIGDYLTQWLPVPPLPEPPVIPELYNLVAIFMNAVAYEVIHGHILIPEGPLDPQWVRDSVRDLEYLLAVDPLMGGVNIGYNRIHPIGAKTAIGLSKTQYGFLDAVNNIYYNAKLSLYPSFYIEE